MPDVRTVVKLAALAEVALLTACATLPGAAPGGNTYELYFLGGQSNMDGYGYVSQLPAEFARESDRVVIYTGQTTPDQEPAGGLGAWAPLRPGHGTGFSTNGRSNRLSDRFGPELSFGHAMAAQPSRARIAIVKYSMGGTALAHGAGFGNWDPDSRDGHVINQYDHALATIANALTHADIDGDGRSDTLVPAGIVWMQGEADAHDGQEMADAYLDNLKRLMDLLRAALRVDDLPVIIGRITDSGMDEDGRLMHYIETVQRAQAQFVATDACAAYVTDTDDFGYLDDGWHYDTAGYIELGSAFARAMRELQRRCKPRR